MKCHIFCIILYNNSFPPWPLHTQTNCRFFEVARQRINAFSLKWTVEECETLEGFFFSSFCFYSLIFSGDKLEACLRVTWSSCAYPYTPVTGEQQPPPLHCLWGQDGWARSRCGWLSGAGPWTTGRRPRARRRCCPWSRSSASAPSGGPGARVTPPSSSPLTAPTAASTARSGCTTTPCVLWWRWAPRLPVGFLRAPWRHGVASALSFTGGHRRI